MNNYELKAKEIERRFTKKVNSGLFFFTGKGKKNVIIHSSPTHISLKTENSVNSFKIPRKRLIEAIAYLLYRRTAVRKSLEKFSNFNSSLMGLLRLIMCDMVKIQKTVKGLLRLTLIGPRFFFSGLDKPSKQDFKTIISNNGHYVLNTYFWLRERGKNLDNWMVNLANNNIKLLIDSGAFSLFNAQKKGKRIVNSEYYLSLSPKERKKNELVREITVEEYANFINHYKSLIYGFFNLDVIGDESKTKENFKFLKSTTGISPIPVWHCDTNNWKDSNFALLENLVLEDHEIIAIGATVELGRNAGVERQNQVKKELFKEIFEHFSNQNFRWLGGSSNLLIDFPFFSADSSGWLQGKQVYTFKTEKSATQIKAKWTKEECLSHNVRTLSSLENMYEGWQLKLNI